eukprot:NODE_2477_length_1165_cov_81.155106_g2360_i0.p1 GENE.NODE_2477_length_1165_cov_81.155106_g2360_i0~~NODE_2477_length_1165_cov_81.155106_g2360_i0.p1  ORF type:complete len:348 (-),score=75.69 NODE_2477_length_1165_cov_81.155106_g2360_i0:122-1165(-)
MSLQQLLCSTSLFGAAEASPHHPTNDQMVADQQIRTQTLRQSTTPNFHKTSGQRAFMKIFKQDTAPTPIVRPLAAAAPVDTNEEVEPASKKPKRVKCNMPKPLEDATADVQAFLHTPAAAARAPPSAKLAHEHEESGDSDEDAADEKRHQEFKDAAEESSAANLRTVFVANCPDFMTEALLRRAFHKYSGAVVAVRLTKVPNKALCGFVVFKTTAITQEVVALKQVSVLGEALSLQFAGVAVQERDARTVRLEGCPDTLTHEDILALWPNAETTRCVINREGRFSGFAFVRFPDSIQAMKVLAQSPTVTIKGATVWTSRVMRKNWQDARDFTPKVLEVDRAKWDRNY